MTESPHVLALDLLDVPWRHRGRSRSGLDCVGLVVLVAQARGMTVKDVRLYGREPTGDLLSQVFRDHFGDPVDRAPAIDDVLVMQLPGQAGNGHAGIVVPHPYGLGICHAYRDAAPKGRVVVQRIDRRRRGQIREVFQWPVKL